MTIRGIPAVGSGRPVAGAAAVALVIALAIGLAVGCGGETVPEARRASGPEALPAGCEVSTPTALVPVVAKRIPHDPTSYVQGLLLEDGVLYESSGRYGESSLRSVDPQTGEVRSRVDLPADVFAEGLAVGHGGELVQLTWKNEVAYRWPIDRVVKGGEPSGEFAYDGEGWGLTTLADGSLLMSDGSDHLVERNPADFAARATHVVRRSGGPADQLNELEFDGTWVWANRYQSDEILRIDPLCWTVTGVVDATKLTDEAEAAAESAGQQIDVLNGVAHIPGGERFLVTGKWWPTMFEVTFVEK